MGDIANGGLGFERYLGQFAEETAADPLPSWGAEGGVVSD